MRSKIVDIGTYLPIDTESYLLDANIWISLCCPMGNHDKQKSATYSAFLKAALNKKAKIIICSMILSEVINTWFRIEFNILHEKNPSIYNDYKRDFRGRDIYKAVAIEIENSVSNQILKFASPIDDGFTQANIKTMLSGIAVTDFNDLCHAELANRENFVFVTNDRDFAFIDRNIKILTANAKMLRSA